MMQLDYNNVLIFQNDYGTSRIFLFLYLSTVKTTMLLTLFKIDTAGIGADDLLQPAAQQIILEILFICHHGDHQLNQRGGQLSPVKNVKQWPPQFP